MKRPVVIPIGADGKPVLAELRMRDSTTVENRKKVVYVCQAEAGMHIRDVANDKRLTPDLPAEEISEETLMPLELKEHRLDFA